MTSFSEFYSKYPNLAFVKTKFKLTDPSELQDENFILEEDTPPLEKGFSIIMPLSVNEYPKIFKMATAMEAGMYAIDICEKQGWEITRAMLYEVLGKLEENLQ
ncbi:MAG: hypothetical protein MJZ37_06860 [Bacilli bacterium]|nr:hypothetical protein [Bacilli bacterium]